MELSHQKQAPISYEQVCVCACAYMYTCMCWGGMGCGRLQTKDLKCGPCSSSYFGKGGLVFWGAISNQHTSHLARGGRQLFNPDSFHRLADEPFLCALVFFRLFFADCLP